MPAEGIQGEKGDKGDKGDSFTFEDFTPEQLESLKGDKGEKGDKGDAFTYEDFTPEQLDTLKGEKGEKGDPGDSGEFSGTHEDLEGLLGGDDTNGHYHLTKAQYEWIIEMTKYPPEIDEGQVISTIAETGITPYEISGLNLR